MDVGDEAQWVGEKRQNGSPRDNAKGTDGRQKGAEELVKNSVSGESMMEMERGVEGMGTERRGGSKEVNSARVAPDHSRVNR